MSAENEKLIPMSRAEKAYYLSMLASNTEFRRKLRNNPRAALKSLGVEIPPGVRVRKPKRLPSRKRAAKYLAEFSAQGRGPQDDSFGIGCEPDPPFI